MKKYIMAAMMIVIVSSIVLAQSVEFTESKPVSKLESKEDMSWWESVWDSLSNLFGGKKEEPPAPKMILIEKDDSIDAGYMKTEPNMVESLCKIEEIKNGTETYPAHDEICFKQNGTKDVFYPKTIPATRYWQEITNGITNITVSDDMWCVQQDDNTIMCKSYRNCDAEARIPDFTNAACTYQRYTLESDGSISTSFSGYNNFIVHLNEQKTLVAEPVLQ